jgi:DNA polymerase (family 10)
MEKKFSNKEVATLLRNVSAAHQVKGRANFFQIRAYDLAADAIEHASSDIRALWETGDLDKIPGVGSNIANYLDELYTTGEVKHFKQVFKGIPDSMFEFLKVPGVGPKTAYKLAKTGVKNTQDLAKQIKSKALIDKGFGQKSLDNILRGIEELERRSDRILLPVAWRIADQVIEHLKKHEDVVAADPLGSLRRKVATVGDIDISVASKKPKEVIEHFTRFPGKERVVEAGEKTATISVGGGIHVDLMVQPPNRYGSLLQHFTGSKAHNIHVRKIAKEKGLSLSEYGIKQVEKEGKQFSEDTLFECETEEEFYKKLGMSYIAPEIREDQGEIKAALANKLPKLVTTEDIKGDLHTHSFWSDGKDSVADMANAAATLGREYIALTDHSYPSLDYERRLKEIEQFNYSKDNIRVISGLEVNINANSTLQITDEVLAKHDIIFASIHTSFRQSREEMTNRIIKAMEDPHVDVLAHPTGRLLLEREGIEANWEKIFKRLAQAKRFGVKFTVNTDSHRIEHLKLMEYGVSVARRGWLQKESVINTLPYSKLKDILGFSS